MLTLASSRCFVDVLTELFSILSNNEPLVTFIESLEIERYFFFLIAHFYSLIVKLCIFITYWMFFSKCSGSALIIVI